MAIVLTNGQHYITTDDSGKIKKVQDIEKAQTFYSCNVAMSKVIFNPKKCEGFFPYDTDDFMNDPLCKKDNTKKKLQKMKRRQYTAYERELVYRKGECKCYICGKDLLLSDMTLDHVVPLAKGGADCLDNLMPCCRECNTWKADSYSGDFGEKISNIFMYQMDDKIGNKIIWRFIKKYLGKQMKDLYG